MKKKFALIPAFALTMSLLTSCELLVPVPTDTPAPTEPTGSAGTGSTEDFTVFPKGNYLADAKFDTDEFLPDYDSDSSFLKFGMTRAAALCQTDDTVYTCTGSFIMYMDKATGISGPLCGKPECLHNGSTCNAYVSRYADGLCIYEGKLQWIDNGTVTRVNLDGTGRETMGMVHSSAYGNLSNPTIAFHRGYVYYAGVGSTVSNGVAQRYVTVIAEPMDGGEQFVIMEKTVGGAAQCRISLVGNDLYVMVYSSSKDTDDSDERKAYTTFYRWDSKTRKSELIAEIRGTEIGMYSEGKDFWPVPGDGIYFQGHNSFDTEDGLSIRDIVCKYSFETEEIREVVSFINRIYPCYTKDFIITWDTLVYAYDYDGNLLFSIPGGEYSITTFAGADDGFIYYHCHPNLGEGEEYFIAIPLDGGEIIVIG